MAHASVFTAFDQLPLADEIKKTAGSAHRVDSNVYIGGFLIAADPGFVQGAGINRIVKLFADDSSYPGGYHRHAGVKYLVVAAEDSPDYDIRPGAFAALRFIQDGIRANEQILVHCHAGISRSATVVLLHLMVNRGYNLKTAFARLRLVRPVVNPNSGFMEHLRATDARIGRLRVGDEHRVVSQREAHHPFTAPRPIAAHDAALMLRLAQGDTSHAGGRGVYADDEPPGSSVVPIAPDPPPTPGAGLWSFADSYDDSTPL